MIVSILGKKYGKEVASLLADADILSNDIFFRTWETKEADIWIMTDWNETAFQAARKKIRPQDTVILNSDDATLLQHMAGMVCHTVTFGYHLKSTLTISGRVEDVTTGRIAYTLALQRPVLSCKKRLLEPCECNWLAPAGVAPQSIMAAVAFFLVADVAFFH